VTKSILAFAAALAATAAGCAAGGQTTAGEPAPAAPAARPQVEAQRVAMTDAEDPFLWLEEVEGERALGWVRERNEATLAQLSAHPSYEPIFERVRSILDANDRIEFPSMMGDWLYNFWQDPGNPRGIWRRTSWESYLSGTPSWDVILDIDALAAAEEVNWSYAGSTCLPPAYERCLVRLSRGGADAVEIREFDMNARRFVEGGFFLPEAKQDVAWMDEDRLLVASDFGPGTMTTSGYARIAKIWRRGTPLAAARTIFEGEESDVSVGVGAWHTADRTFNIVSHRRSIFRGTVHILEGDELVRLDIPMDASPGLVRDRMLVYLRSPWEVAGRSYPGGALLDIAYDDFVRGARAFQVVLQPTERQTISRFSTTRDYVLVDLLDNVQGELRRYRFADGAWSYEAVPAPRMGSIGVAGTSPFHNRYFFSYGSFVQPPTLYLAHEDGSVRELRRSPARFDAEGIVVEQHEVASKDGVRVPYFVVRHRDTRPDGTNPTLLYAYGGFQVPSLPWYNATVGSAWLERGGVYVLANIRGGGEFGPEWHRAGLKENRQRVFDDFIAVAEDIIARRITTPRHLGIMGGSNGGLLVGAALTQRPELFNAVVVQVPLLDMRRYHRLLAGASWMAEYGNPDRPEEWAYISQYSPYQNVRPGMPYPKVLFTTTTRDDRVHPGHARKMAALMESMGYPVHYFENTEGGHGAGVTSEQRARTTAVTWAYLWERLAGAPTATR
jgi:prolyl oligopeptidase